MPPYHQLAARRLVRPPFGHNPRWNLLAVTLILGINFGSAEVAQGQRYRKPVNKQSVKLGPCLPPNISVDQIATYSRKKNVTVGEKLKELNARCLRGRIVGSDNKEIRLFRVACWGIPPPDYLETQAAQKRKLEELKLKYTVIVISCDPRIP